MGLPGRNNLLLFMAVVCFACSGCKRDPKLTLREAEDLGKAWLANVQELMKPQSEVQEAANQEAAEEEGEEYRPPSLRDCFVDDGWDAQGFRNPTEAIAWLTEQRRAVGRVTSVEAKGAGAEVAFEMTGQDRVALVAWIVEEDGLPKCKSLRKAREQDKAASQRQSP